MFKKFIKFIKSIFSIEESPTFKENVKSEYHFKVQPTDAGAYFTYVPGPIPEQGEVGTMYLINKYSGIQLWDGERYLPVVSINEHSDPLILYVTELPLFGKPNTIYVLKDPTGYTSYFEWDSEKNEYIKTEVSSDESKPKSFNP